MKHKRLLSLLLAVVMVLGMLSGCGNNQPATTDPVQGTTETNSSVTEENIETICFDYFAEDNLPELATEKNNEQQVKMCFEAYRKGDNWKVLFD